MDTRTKWHSASCRLGSFEAAAGWPSRMRCLDTCHLSFPNCSSSFPAIYHVCSCPSATTFFPSSIVISVSSFDYILIAVLPLLTVPAPARWPPQLLPRRGNANPQWVLPSRPLQVPLALASHDPSISERLRVSVQVTSRLWNQAFLNTCARRKWCHIPDAQDNVH